MENGAQKWLRRAEVGICIIPRPVLLGWCHQGVDKLEAQTPCGNVSIDGQIQGHGKARGPLETCGYTNLPQPGSQDRVLQSVETETDPQVVLNTREEGREGRVEKMDISNVCASMFGVRRVCGGGVVVEKGAQGQKVAWWYLLRKHNFAPPQEKNGVRHRITLAIL
jgi:hypothetical protein